MLGVLVALGMENRSDSLDSWCFAWVEIDIEPTDLFISAIVQYYCKRKVVKEDAAELLFGDDTAEND